MTLTFGSLFAGIGGIDLGLERAGMECKWQVEIDAFCRNVLQKYWPQVPKFGDIKELTGDELTSVDVVAGGFPCQPASNAGIRGGQSDSRWLWPHFARIVTHLRPRYIIMENVPGLLTVDNGHAFERILTDLADLGFDAEWETISACSFGAPHSRSRLFLVAYPPSNDGPDEGEEKEPFSFGLLQPGREGSDDGNRRWLPEPEMDRVAHGISSRVVRPQLTAIGNAVIPQIPEWIGHRIMEINNTERTYS